MKYYDEDDVRTRPPRGSRPRTRRRPAYAKARTGFVIAVDRGRYTCDVEGHVITATRARELGRRSVVVGDFVTLVGDVSGMPGTLARIVRIAERKTVLRRSVDDGDDTERIAVANAETMVIVASLAEPPPRLGLIDRCLVAAEDENITPLLVLTKADLAGPEDVQAYYSAVDIPLVVWQQGDSVEELHSHIVSSTSVFVGHSGVGKSTLVNALMGDSVRRIGNVSAVGKGRHTSTSVEALHLSGGGWIIDTPGIRSFGLAHIPPIDLIHGFSDLLNGSLACEPGCDHRKPQQGCTLDAWVAAGHAPAARLASFRSLLASLTPHT